MLIGRRRFLAYGAASVGSAYSAARLLQIRPDGLEEFRRRFKGSIILSGDADYDHARAVASFNPHTDKRPRLIARCVNGDDVMAALEFARTQSLEVAVRGGGHDLLGASVCEGGIVIDLSRMKSIAVDREKRTARVGPGARSGELNAATSPFGLAAVLGCNPAVGVAGLTLGGGLGWLLGRFGAACDNLLAADVICADGGLRHASADENADLFWALRGGGGNFGIVTSLECRLHPVGQVYGGVIAFRGEVGPFLRFYRDFMRGAQDELAIETTIIILEEPVILCTVCWSGEPSEGRRILEPLTSFGPPVANAIGNVSYLHLTDRPSAEFGARVFGVPAPSGATAGIVSDYWKGGSLAELSNQAIEQIESTARRGSSGMSIGIGHYMHGEICRIREGATPMRRTAGQFTFFFDAKWRSAARAETAMGWVDESLSAMRPFSSSGAYVNYLSSDDEDAVRASYGMNYERLAILKRKFDPENIFHLNRNIRP